MILLQGPGWALAVPCLLQRAMRQVHLCCRTQETSLPQEQPATRQSIILRAQPGPQARLFLLDKVRWVVLRPPCHQGMCWCRLLLPVLAIPLEAISMNSMAAHSQP